MPSTNKLHGVKNYSNHKNRLFGLLTQRKRDSKSFLRTKEHVAQQLLFLCGIITSFVVTGMSFSLINSDFNPLASILPYDGNAHASSQVSGSSSIITVNLTEGLAVRTLDSTATNTISSLDLKLTPTPTGSFVRDTSIIDVATSNPSGYNLYMTSMGKDHSNNYTSSLVHSDTTISDVIATLPVSGVTESAFSSPSTTASPNPYVDKWGYSINAKTIDTSGTSPVISDVTTPSTITYNSIPLHGTSDTLRSDVKTATESSMTPVTIGVNTDTSILSGTYSNTLLFTAAANPPYVGYTLKFNPNIDGAGGSGSGSDIASNMPATMTETVMATSYKFTVPDTIPTRPNYAFSSWNSKPDGTGTTYHAGDKVEVIAEDLSDLSDVKAEATIYAMWTQYNYTVTYNCNSGSGCPSNQTIVTGDNPYTYTIPSTAPTRTNYNFKGYLGSDGTTYQPGDTVSLTPSSPSITLIAQWKQVYTYSISYNCNSGSGCPSNFSTTSENTSYSYTISSTAPTRTNYNFTNYTGSDGTTYSAGGTVSLSTSKTSVTLTANWVAAGPATITVGGRTWTASTASTSSTWSNAASVCSNLGSGWRLPTAAEFRTLIGSTEGYAGTNTANINTIRSSWGTGSYWSSTVGSLSSRALYLSLGGGSASVGENDKTVSCRVVCTK